MKKDNMGKRKNFLFYFLLMMVIFVIVMNLIVGYGSSFLGNLLQHLIYYTKYGVDMYFELIMGFIAILIMLISGNSYVFSEKKKGFFKSLLQGWPELILVFPILIYSIQYVVHSEFNLLNLLSLIIYCFAIGLAEEIICRAWLQNEFLERFGNTKKGIVLSIGAAALIFGLMHFVNVFVGQSIFDTILQIISAAAGGFLYGIVYYKTKNIWSVIFLHAIWDFAIFLSSYNLVMDCEMIGAMSNEYVIFSWVVIIIQSIFYIITSIYILRGIFADFDKENTRKEVLFSKKDNKSKLLLGLAFIFFFMYVGINYIDIDSGDYEEVCYDFEEMNITEYQKVTTYYDKYNIELNYTSNESIEDIPFSGMVYYNDDKLIIKNINTSEEVTKEFDNIYDITVIDNNDTFTIIVNVLEDGEYKVYYSNYISPNTVDNSDDFLNKLKNSFVELYLPSINSIGYFTITGDDYKYPFFISEASDIFTVNKDGQESIVNVK